ncbi:MAG: metal ABC transporter solute-binding protein, Zn/Mn family [Planctomycetota bacterium]|jgi:manganese/zinc/iron transport system substrate-binding protein
MLEGKMSDALVRVARGGKPVYAVTELVDEAYLLEPEALAGHFDPHLWMDVGGWTKAVEAVARALADHDPDRAADYERNAAACIDELRGLDEYARRVIGSIPARSRLLVTAHDAFNYFGRAYGIEVRGIQGISTESEAGLEDINRLVDLLVERDVRAVFVETSVADRNVRALIEGARARGHDVTIGGSLFSDAMGAPGTYEGTYAGMIDHNVTVIARALGGDAPARGLNGRLAAPGQDDS